MTLILLAGGFGATGVPTIDSFKLDATVTLTPRRSTTVTKHPIEGGSTVSDHIFKNNTIIDVTGVVVNTPMPQSFRDAQLGRDRVATTPPGRFDRVQSAHDVLVKAFEDQEILIISTELDSFSNCIITDLSMPRSAEIGDSLRVEMTLEQIQIVGTDITEVSPAIFDAASTNTKVGGKSTKDDNSPDLKTEDQVRFTKSKEVLNDLLSEIGL
jgi:hypothetical protein